ncbi:MAG: helix-turn-helix domain-containing protein [Hyphomicrobiaceae bacterium]
MTPAMSVAPASDKYLTTTETATILRVSPRTLERKRRAGTGPKFLKVGPGKRARVLYVEPEVYRWLNSFQFGSTTEYQGLRP